MVAVNDKCPLRSGDLLQLGETFLYVEEVASPSSAFVSDSPIILPEKPWEGENLLVRCCRIVDETPDVKTFYFVAEPPVLFSYLPGQFVNVEVEIDGKSVIRSYSISSSPTRPYHLSMTVKRVPSPLDQPDVPAGLISNWLHDHLHVGDRIKLSGPMGHFTCLPNLPSKLLLISAGSGITPMMSMSRWVQDTLADCDVVFLHSARTSEDIVFRAELEAIAAQMPNFHLAITVTQQPLARSWMGLTGRISESMLNLVAPDLLERAVYVCGPNPFMQSIRSLLESMQFPMQNYKEESFGGKRVSTVKAESAPASISQTEPMLNGSATSRVAVASNGSGQYAGNLARAKSGTATATPEIHFAQSERTVEADGSSSVLEIAEQEGVEIRNACRVGACGACKVRVLKGEVRYDTSPTALTKVDQQAGYALACVAYPVAQVAIEA
jgi:ferredoxin-NADP reductase